MSRSSGAGSVVGGYHHLPCSTEVICQLSGGCATKDCSVLSSQAGVSIVMSRHAEFVLVIAGTADDGMWMPDVNMQKPRRTGVPAGLDVSIIQNGSEF